MHPLVKHLRPMSTYLKVTPIHSWPSAFHKTIATNLQFMTVMVTVAQNGFWSMMEILLLVVMGTLDDLIQHSLGPVADYYLY